MLDLFLQPLKQVLQEISNSPRATAVLCVIGAIYLLFRANAFLSKWTLNNYTVDRTWDWKREVVVVTGGSSGIGASTVELLASRGIKVLILDMVEPRKKLGSNVIFYEIDIANADRVKSLAMKVRSEHGDPTVLINNAGIGSAQPILARSEEQIRRVFDVNIISHFTLIKEFLPAMVARNHGHIVTVASMVSFMSLPSNVDYACTKAAALAFHEGLGQELRFLYKAPRVRTTIVHPSLVRTPLVQQFLDKAIPQRMIIEPKDLAEAIVNQVLSGFGGQLIVPSTQGVFTLARGLPLWAQELMRNQVSKTLSQWLR